ncbi:MAG: protein kinase [Acidobacteriota bacterium]
MLQQIGPYRVEERLGAGGMGEVYKAYDSRLERWVAIKRIRSDKNEAEENRQRFQREARATAKLNHSSIVHLYDIFQDGDSDCIVMEYVEGKTLDQLIRNGPLEPLQATALGGEIAAGLTEAHSKGIIHRDLKVENIIVTPEGHAKILDFGLARPLLKDDFETSLTGKGQLVGTSRTMSPEYVSGEEIDHRSDLFSLGVLLYEAVTSHSPFRAHNTLATLKQVMLHRQTPAHHVNAHVPEELSDIIENLLEKDPADRPQSAEAVAFEFRRISGHLSSGEVDRPMSSSTFSTTPTEIFTPSATSVDLWARRRWLSVAAGLVLVTLAGAYALTRWRTDQASPGGLQRASSDLKFQERDRLVLADFENHTGEPVFDHSLEIAFRHGLEQSRHASVLPKSEIRSALSRMVQDPDSSVDRELAIEIGQREDARAAVIGAILKIGETYSLTADVVAPDTGLTMFTVGENAASQNDIVTALEKLTNSIRFNLGESLAVIERGQDQRPLEKVTTQNLQALKAYSLGYSKFAERDFEAAIHLLKNAIELDSDFAMAHAKLAASYFATQRPDIAKPHLEKALGLANRLTEIENLYLKGWEARLRGDPEAVVHTWSLMSTLYPNEFVGQFNLGMARYLYLAQFGEAAQAFEDAVLAATAETRPPALNQLGYTQIVLGQEDEALATFERLEPADRQTTLADLYLAKREYSAAEDLLRETVAGPAGASRFDSLLRLAYLYSDQGRFDDALREALEARRLALADNSSLSLLVSRLALIAIYGQLEEDVAFFETLSAATDTALSLIRVDYEQFDAAPLLLLAQVGKYNARAQRLDEAQSVLDGVQQLAQTTSIVVWQGAAAMLEGEILLARGQLEQAVDIFQLALSLADLFQTRESLARAYEATGLPLEAIQEYEWILEHRGVALIGECQNPCLGVNFNAWSLALYRVARLHDEAGNRDLALRYYQQFIDHWPKAEGVTIWQTARARAAELQQ